jgi:hypothetical protein
MSRVRVIMSCVVVFVAMGAGLVLINPYTNAAPSQSSTENGAQPIRRPYMQGFNVDVFVNGRPLSEYYARGKTYVEALEGAEYELRITNPLPERIAVALSVDGLNTLDARNTSAWNASKWVIGPYETITVGGWQMSSDRARRFYFTNEQDSYGAKLGKTSNLGAIAAVFFRERRHVPVTITPPRPVYRDDRERDRAQSSDQSSRPGRPAGVQDPSSNSSQAGQAAKEKRGQVSPMPDDEYAATGIGRSVQNEVRWVNMELDSQPAAEMTIRYEYYSALVRLGVIPRQYGEPDPLRRRERSKGFEDRRFSPEP